jgi:hypothetical protein
MDSDPSESPTEPAGTAVPPSAPTPPPEPTLLPSTVAATPTPSPAPTAPPTAPALPPVPPVPPVPPAATPPPPPSLPPASPSPAGGSGGGDRRHAAPLPQLITELREMVVTYVKQQTLIPLKQLGRYVGFGILGSLLLGFGVVFLALGGLRLLQTETGSTFTGDWSWVPYLIMVFVLALGAALVWLLRTASRAEREAQSQ